MLQLLTEYNGQPVKGWLMSEKFDGVRAYWNGYQFMTRNNNIINAPLWFCENMPTDMVDGELWVDRGRLEKTAGAVRKGASSNLWCEIKFKAFDLPFCAGNFNNRLSKLKMLTLPAHCQIVEQIIIKDTDHIDDFYSSIVNNCGEGLVFKDPCKLYNSGRTRNALKYIQESSAEVKIVGINRHDDLTFKSLQCTFNDQIFNLSAGMSEYYRNKPPKIGANVTIKHNGLTSNNQPRNAVFITTRDYE